MSTLSTLMHTPPACVLTLWGLRAAGECRGRWRLPIATAAAPSSVNSCNHAKTSFSLEVSFSSSLFFQKGEDRKKKFFFFWIKDSNFCGSPGHGVANSRSGNVVDSVSLRPERPSRRTWCHVISGCGGSVCPVSPHTALLASLLEVLLVVFELLC